MTKLKYTPKKLIGDLVLVFNIIASIFAILIATPLLIILFLYILTTRPFKEWLRGRRKKKARYDILFEIRNHDCQEQISYVLLEDYQTTQQIF